MLYDEHPAHEGRFLEAILKAERDVASTAAGNRGHEKPGTAARQKCLVAWEPSRRTRQRGRRRDLGRQHHGGAPRGGPPGCAGGLMPRKRGVARYCATRIKAGPLWALRQSTRSGGRQRRRRKEEEEPGRKTSRDEETGCLTW